MRIESSSGKGNFNLVNDGKVICELDYKNWFSGKASVVLRDDMIDTKPKSIWANKILLFKNERAIGEIDFNWKGHMIIRLNESKSTFLLKAKGFWKLGFELFDASEELVFTMNAVNRWTKLKYDYEIEIVESIAPENMNELVLYSGYASNLYAALIAAV